MSSDLKKEVGQKVLASAGAVLMSTSVEAVVAVIRRHPHTYSKSGRARLDALKSIYRNHYPDPDGHLPDIWVLDSVNHTPTQEFDSGTWEEYWMRELKVETTGLRSDVEGLLSIISSFLDQRRMGFGALNGRVLSTHQGDVVEKFFSEMIKWIIKHLDCDAKDDIVGLVQDRMKYLRNVMESREVFPNKVLGRPSSSVVVISKILDKVKEIELKIKGIHESKFLLEKFRHIFDCGGVLLKHFLDGFFCFSPVYRKETWGLSLLKVREETKYGALLHLFLERAYICYSGQLPEEPDDCNGMGKLSREKIEAEMQDIQKFGIDLSTTPKMRSAIPDIFITAYNFSMAMRLIGYACVALSEQGTVQLFYSKKGRDGYNFLISNLKSKMQLLCNQLSAFHELGQKHVEDVRINGSVLKQNLIDQKQYPRFRSRVEHITGRDSKGLIKLLDNVSEKIKEFDVIKFEEFINRQQCLYEAIDRSMFAEGHKGLIATDEQKQDNARGDSAAEQHLPKKSSMMLKAKKTAGFGTSTRPKISPVVIMDDYFPEEVCAEEQGGVFFEEGQADDIEGTNERGRSSLIGEQQILNANAQVEGLGLVDDAIPQLDEKEVDMNPHPPERTLDQSKEKLKADGQRQGRSMVEQHILDSHVQSVSEFSDMRSDIYVPGAGASQILKESVEVSTVQNESEGVSASQILETNNREMPTMPRTTHNNKFQEEAALPLLPLSLREKVQNNGNNMVEEKKDEPVGAAHALVVAPDPAAGRVAEFRRLVEELKREIKQCEITLKGAYGGTGLGEQFWQFWQSRAHQRLADKCVNTCEDANHEEFSLIILRNKLKTVVELAEMGGYHNGHVFYRAVKKLLDKCNEEGYKLVWEVLENQPSVETALLLQAQVNSLTPELAETRSELAEKKLIIAGLEKQTTALYSQIDQLTGNVTHLKAALADAEKARTQDRENFMKITDRLERDVQQVKKESAEQIKQVRDDAAEQVRQIAMQMAEFKSMFEGLLRPEPEEQNRSRSSSFEQ